MGLTELNVGTSGILITILNVAVVAHSPELGVKVYVVVTWLFNAGLQVPEIPFSEFVGSAAKFSP